MGARVKGAGILRAWLMTVLTLLLFAAGASAQKGGTRPHSPCKHWKAWLNLQPGTAPPTLHVTGSCEFPTAGYTVELVPVVTKNAAAYPEIYVVKRVVHKPEGMVAQVITEAQVDYRWRRRPSTKRSGSSRTGRACG